MADDARDTAAVLVGESVASVGRLLDGPLLDALAASAEAVADALMAGGRALALGNGGSAAEAGHLVAELVGRCTTDRRPLPAIALSEGGPSLTALANDYGYDEVFARQVQAHARPGDVVVALSTSGRSRNVLRALDAARVAGATTVGLSGPDGGEMGPLCDHLLRAPATGAPRIQECHQVWVHVIAEWVEQRVLV